jgi:hypothetical protein
MEKKAFALENPENVSIVFKGIIIDIKPYLTIAEQLQLINSYIQNYFFPDEEEKLIGMIESDPFNTEYALRLEIIDMCTSIDGKSVESVNVFYTGLWEKIENSIINYNEFRSILSKIINEIEREQSLRKSIGSVIDGLMSRIESILVELNESLANFKPEDIDKIKEAGLSMLKEVENSSVAGLFKEVKLSETEKFIATKKTRNKKVA